MNAPKPIAEKQSGHALRNVVVFFAFALAAIASFFLLQRFYFVQELLFFVGMAALAMLLVVSLIVLGLLFRRAYRFVFPSLPSANKTLVTGRKPLAERRDNPFVTAPPIATEADSGST